MGSTNRPFYRLVAIDSRNRRDGRSVAELGYYDPLKKPAVVKLEEEPILEWLRRGAAPSDTVRELLREQGVLQKFELMKGGTSVVDATQRVAARLATRTVKEKKVRPSKKARAKAVAAKGAEAAAEAGSSTDA
jgi:small subunit ribosomal protein S16